jgi:hypothetical protein
LVGGIGAGWLQPQRIAIGQRVRDGVAADGQLAEQWMPPRQGVEPTADPAQLPVAAQARQRLIDGGAAAEAEEIAGRKHLSSRHCAVSSSPERSYLSN